MDNVNCVGGESTLLQCDHSGLFKHNCDHGKDVSVRCILREDQRVKNITLSVEIINNSPSTVHTVLISWVLYNNTLDEPNSFDVRCSSGQHSTEISVSGQQFSTYLIGLLRVTDYNCCVSAVYELYRADGICTEITTPELFITPTTMLRASETKAVSGVLGFFVAILLVLLIISGVALAYLLLPKWKRNAILTSR